jgi:hypothetical protein
VRKNGIDIPRSNTKLGIPNTNTEMIMAVPFLIPMNTSDMMQIMYGSTDSTLVQMLYSPIGYNPVTPSIIMTITKVSELI